MALRERTEELIAVGVRVKIVTAKAMLCSLEDHGFKEAKWIPKSVCDFDVSTLDADAKKGDEGVLMVKKWFAAKEDLL